MSTLSIKPVESPLYKPYFNKNPMHLKALPYALGLYKQATLEGARNIEGGDPIPFVVSWTVSALPSDFTDCRLIFDGNAQMSYQATDIPNPEFIGYLIELIIAYNNSKESKKPIDFPQAFYGKLLNKS